MSTSKIKLRLKFNMDSEDQEVIRTIAGAFGFKSVTSYMQAALQRQIQADANQLIAAAKAARESANVAVQQSKAELEGARDGLNNAKLGAIAADGGVTEAGIYIPRR